MFTKSGDAAVLAKLAKAPAPYREIGERLHQLVREHAPTLEPVVRWGLVFYVRGGADMCYIKSGDDFIVFGFGESLNPAFEAGNTLHPVVWNITGLDAAAEATLSKLIRRVAA